MNLRQSLSALCRRGAGVRTVAATLLLALAPAGPARGAASELPGQPETVRVERVRPRRESLITLTFLKTNLDFIRVRLDQLRERPLAESGPAPGMDPRFLAYRSMMERARITSDSLAGTASDREHRALLASVTEFARLEAELDQMDTALADEHERLTALQADFTGRQTTALAIVLSGYPAGVELSSITVRFDDGSSRDLNFSTAEHEALAHGGVLELFHGRVEPRSQVFEVKVEGAGLASGETGFVTLNPGVDRLTFLRLDLAALRPPGGASSVLATTWLHDDSIPANDEPDPRP